MPGLSGRFTTTKVLMRRRISFPPSAQGLHLTACAKYVEYVWSRGNHRILYRRFHTGSYSADGTESPCLGARPNPNNYELFTVSDRLSIPFRRGVVGELYIGDFGPGRAAIGVVPLDEGNALIDSPFEFRHPFCIARASIAIAPRWERGNSWPQRYSVNVRGFRIESGGESKLCSSRHKQ